MTCTAQFLIKKQVIGVHPCLTQNAYKNVEQHWEQGAMVNYDESQASTSCFLHS
jgi:hypothetical protein